MMKVYIVMNTESYHEYVERIFKYEKDAVEYIDDSPCHLIEEHELTE